jgi:hypothetical protein
MKDRKIAFTMRVSASVLADLRLRAKQQCVPVQDLARFCLERSLLLNSLDDIRQDLIDATKGLVAACGSANRDRSYSLNGSMQAVLKSILFTEQYLRSLALKELDPIGVAERVSSKKLKEINL